LSLEIKTGTIALPLIEEKTGFGSFRLSGQTLRTLLFHKRAGPGIENNMVPL
jgi:hypothetical protein